MDGLIEAMTSSLDSIRHYYHRDTGEVVTLSDEFGTGQLEGPAERYQLITPLSVSERFQIMEDFVESREDVMASIWYPEDPELSFIKRVVGLPGETVEVRNGNVYVDGILIDEPYVIVDNADRRSFASQEIRPGHYFVLGDNRRGSNDSRSWGLVPERYIYGKAFVRIWPLRDVGAVD